MILRLSDIQYFSQPVWGQKRKKSIVLKDNPNLNRNEKVMRKFKFNFNLITVYILPCKICVVVFNPLQFVRHKQ